ncbi:MAG: phage antirepressor N-terminal domain-containing protein [Acetobacter syzygii]|uniref:phage antirepressor N-terminal domain-containing protein n=1 Tax=Acetobacter syzygii TaxID=146476 RepID=UPI0039E80034
MSKQLTTIEFHGAKLIAVAGDRPESTLVAMKPIVEGMGLDWTYQSRKLQSHPVLSTCVAITAIQMEGDDQVRDHTFLALNRLNFWLATIHPDRVKDESVRQAVIVYQTELADVAFNHFFGKVIASGAHLTAKEAGGIAKGVVNKALTPISAKLDELMQKIDGSLAIRPAGVAVTSSRTARGWLQHYGVVKRKRGMSQRVSSALKSLSFRMGYVISQTTEEGKLCFHEAVANAYFTVGAGRHLLPKAVKGQKEMGLEATPIPFSQTPA